MKEKGRKVAEGDKGKWGKRGLSRLIFGQRKKEIRKNELWCNNRRESEENKNKDKKMVVIKLN
jgi:hypothetical protein